MSTDQTEILGVNEARAAFARLGWFPKDAERPDNGVDMFVETANEDGRPSGRLLGVQVKSGTSYLVASGDGVVRPEQRHIEYWSGYSLPIIVVVYDPEAGLAYWQHVRQATIESTGTGQRIVVPKSQTLGASTRTELLAIAADGPEPDQAASALNRLRADLTWMEVLEQGGTVALEAEEWINKVSGAGQLRLIVEPAQGGETIERTFVVFLGLRPYSEALPELFPWADVHADEDALREADEAEWMEETGIWDSEEKRYVGNSESISEWRVGRHPAGDLRPYGESAGEVAHWRLLLELNDLGRGVVALERFARR